MTSKVHLGLLGTVENLADPYTIPTPPPARWKPTVLPPDPEPAPADDTTLPCLLNSSIFWGLTAALLTVWAIIVRVVLA